MIRLAGVFLAVIFLTVGCDTNDNSTSETEKKMDKKTVAPSSVLLDKYTEFSLYSDFEGLTENHEQIISLLIDAASSMDSIFWMQAFGDKDSLLKTITDPDVKAFAEINYGPWDRLDDNKPFISGIGPKPPGANFYPPDITVDELMTAAGGDSSLLDPYTIVRRDKDGKLISIPYHVAYAPQMSHAASRLRDAASLTHDAAFKKYLLLRADALETSDYQASDMAWMDMKSNILDIVIGPIENYEDELRGYKTGAEAYVLIKDTEWSDRLSHYAALLPELQKRLPVDDKYKQESPGLDSDLNAYDAVYYAGDANAGSKTIAINLPNDEEVQLKKGSRRLQLKNAMRAKFDRILVPIAYEVIDADQREHVTFDAFFENVMFHEVAHGLGIKETVNGKGNVQLALAENYSALEEGKADILGLFMVTQLVEMGELPDTDLMDNYVTFLAGIFRSVRFGASSAHGKANMIRFNYFEEKGAFTRDEEGLYRVEFEAMQAAMNELSKKILMYQGDGAYEDVTSFVARYGVVREELASDLSRINDAGIPVDIVFKQGKSVLGLNPNFVLDTDAR